MMLAIANSREIVGLGFKARLINLVAFECIAVERRGYDDAGRFAFCMFIGSVRYWELGVGSCTGVRPPCCRCAKVL